MSTVEDIAHYVHDNGGQLQIEVIFGDEHYVLRGIGADAA